MKTQPMGKQTPNRPSVIKLNVGHVGLQLLRFSLPMLIGLFAISVANYLMLLILSPYGNVPQAAVGYFFPIMMISIGVNFGCSVGVTSYVARSVGSGNINHARLLAHRGVVMVTMLNLVIGGIFLASTDFFLHHLATPIELREHMKGVMIGWFSTVFLISPMIIANGALRGAGSAFFPGISLAIYACVHVMSTLFVVYVSGSKIAENLGLIFIISNIVMCVVYQLLVPNFSRFMKWSVFFRNMGRLEDWWRDAKSIFRVSIPAVAGQTLASLNLMVLAIYFQSYGLTEITAFAVISRSEFLMLTPLIAMQVSVVAFSGQNVASGRSDRVIEALKLLTFTAVLYCVLLVLMFTFIPGVAAITNGDPRVVELVRNYFLIVCLSFAIEGMFLFGAAVYNGCGMAVKSLLLHLLRLTVLLIPFLAIGDHFLGISGLAWGVAASNVSIGVITFFMLRRFFSQLRSGETVVTPN